MGKIRNHPKHGDRIKAEPIRTVEDVSRIKVLLRNNPRDLAIFTLGVNSPLRPSDLLHVKVGMVRNLRPGDTFAFNGITITVNQPVVQTIDKLLVAMSSSSVNDYLFQSKKSTGRPLGVSSLHRLVKSWCADAGLDGNFGSHSLRKSFGYINRTEFKVDLGQLASMFNHPYKRQTISYLCLPPEELNNIRLLEI
jgi:integrase